MHGIFYMFFVKFVVETLIGAHKNYESVHRVTWEKFSFER